MKPSIVNIKDFGAIGNRIANDAPAIQAAIDHLAAQGGGTVLVAPGSISADPSG